MACVGSWSCDKCFSTCGPDPTVKLVLVEWWDSHQNISGWAAVADITPDLPLIRSVGWVVHDTPECLVLVANHGEETRSSPEQACGEMTIPKVCVKRVRRLREP